MIGGWFASTLTLLIVQAQWPSVHRHCRSWFRPGLHRHRDYQSLCRPSDKLIAETCGRYARSTARRICMQPTMIVIYVRALASWRLPLGSTMLSGYAVSSSCEWVAVHWPRIIGSINCSGDAPGWYTAYTEYWNLLRKKSRTKWTRTCILKLSECFVRFVRIKCFYAAKILFFLKMLRNVYAERWKIFLTIDSKIEDSSL